MKHSKTISLRMLEAEAEKLAESAQERGVKKSAIVRQALTLFFESAQSKNPAA